MRARSRQFIGLASLGMLTIAIAALSQPRQDLRLTTSLANAITPDSVYIAARATNTGSEALRIVGGIDFQLEYRTSAWSESMLVVRRDSFLTARGDTLARDRHFRCGELPEPPSLRGWSSYSLSPEVVVLGPGESLTDTFVFAPRRTLFKGWPGRIIVKSALWIETGRSSKPHDVYTPEDAWVSIPVP